MYTWESRVRYSEIGEDKRLTLNGILNYFQDTSTFQSEDVGNGMDMLEELQRAWVLSSWQIVVREYPRFGERIRLSTAPYDFQRFLGSRNFMMYGSDGRILAYANSLWAYVDTKTGRPARIDEAVLKMYPLDPKYEMEYADRKITLPEQMTAKQDFFVEQSHLDTNHHVNNGQYVKMAGMYLPKDFEVGQMRAEYKRSALLGDHIFPKAAAEADRVTVSLENESGNGFATIEFSRKQIKREDEKHD